MPVSANVALPFALTLLIGSLGLQGCSRERETGAAPPPAAATAPHSSSPVELIHAPGMDQRKLVAPLADAWNRIDPLKDGWESEAQSEKISSKLKHLAKAMHHPADLGGEQYRELVGDGCTSGPLRAANLSEAYRNTLFTVRRGELDATAPHADFPTRLRELLAAFDPGTEVQAELKLYRIVPEPDKVQASALVHLTGKSGAGRLQINSEWVTTWTPDDTNPMMLGVRALHYEEVRRPDQEGAPQFADATSSVLGGTKAYQEQFLRSTDYWRAHLAVDFGLDVVANHGLALGDVNGDGLEDLYVCQQGGLPNRLFVRKPDGSMEDITATSGTGWLDYCASALILDMDNDGDKDLVVSQDFKILFMDNMGKAKFELALGLGTHSQTFSLAAADYDQDGDLDLYLCGYNPAPDRRDSGAMGSPMPYHDARNGGRNMLLRNDGNWEFTEVTAETGLDQNNNRFSFSATWVDYDLDRDLDLYVANDYGRNNLYQNIGGKFHDVAATAGVEDMGASMSASWGDYNRDGRPDLYVSNMFSAAGNRITYQRQFKAGTDDKTIAEFRRHARGNSLFEGSADGTFQDVTEAMGVNMGRWAWGSRFADLDNDGWEDLIVANGFISAPDPGDL